MRSLNQAGVEKLRTYFSLLKAGGADEAPRDMLTSSEYSTEVHQDVVLEPREFASKFEFGSYIDALVGGKVSERVLRTDSGLWAWLTLFYIDQVCPPDSAGRRKPLSLEKYIPSKGHISTGLDKHLLFFPWKMVSLHKSEAAWLLAGAIAKDTKVVRELANSYRRNVSPTYISLAKLLYFDTAKNKVRSGATTTTGKGGSLRRLDRVVSQLDLTYDVFGVSPLVLAELLPKKEFKSWLTKLGKSGASQEVTSD